MKVKTLFIGTSEFAVPILKKLTELDYIDLIGVITQPDKPVGRKQIITFTPIKQSIVQTPSNSPLVNGEMLKIYQPENLKVEAQSILEETNPELIIVASYGQFIPKVMLDYPKYKCLNIHGSLLPDLRGAVPIPMAILKGYEKTGVTLQIMSEGMDEGEVLGTREQGIGDRETTGTLIGKLSELSVDMLQEILPKWINGELEPQKQDESKATYCYIKDVSKEKAEIDWTKPAEEIERMVRAFDPTPISWCKFQNFKSPAYAKALAGRQIPKKLLINSCKMVGDQDFDPVTGIQNSDSAVGEIFRNGKQLFVKCGDGKYLELLSLQLEGKERRGSSEYLFLVN